MIFIRLMNNPIFQSKLKPSVKLLTENKEN